ALHILVIVLIVVAAIVAAKLALDAEKPVPIDTLTFVYGGGGGNPRGVGKGPGVGDPAVQPEDAGQEPEEGDPDIKPIKREDLIKPQDDVPLKLPEFKDDPDAQELLKKASRAARSAASLSQDTRATLRKGITAGHGEGGPGREGGKDRGKDKGKGGGEGAGKGTLSKREKRVLRWTMIFDTVNGDDYARQLHGLGAILAIPKPGPTPQYEVLRDLSKRPAKGKVEDLADIKRIYWVDNKPESVRSLSLALRLDQVPPHIVAFFPEKLEAELLKLETDYARQRFNIRSEDQIHETKFKVVRRGGGYAPVVIDLVPNR
ncbi:MAG TPA: hypothetical protein VFA26_17550, partial [Gemmataceae bacterium]|nr:hypothetical protein [Gemmataceae bacterium]